MRWRHVVGSEINDDPHSTERQMHQGTQHVDRRAKPTPASAIQLRRGQLAEVGI
jgi:hypothetical protein